MEGGGGGDKLIGGGGWASDVLPLQKEGWGKTCLSNAEGGGGGHKTFGVVSTQEFEVVAVLKGTATHFDL